ncbi:MAG: cadherin-like domain-containing protein, partial [Arenicella sp.]|nr:cadherin-like domain-containing protein [Arenicella sp.]
PRIDFVNITEMQRFAQELQPNIDISDQHLDRITMLLNGEPFFDGQTISETGDFTLQVNAFDLAGNTQRASVRFAIGQQQPAVVLTAKDDLLELRRGGLGNVKLLANDVFRDLGDLIVTITRQPENGRLVRLATGDYNYSPGLLFIGSDSFSYSIADTISKETSTANVTVTIRPGASCSFVPDHSTAETQPVLLPAWARSIGDNQAPRFRVRLTSVSDLSAFEIAGAPTITFPDCSLSYTAKADTRATVKVMYVVEDVETGGRSYTSPLSTFKISINTKTDNSSVVIPVLQLLLLQEDHR